LDNLLASDDVVGHELVLGELLIGDTGGRQEFLTAYVSIHQAITVPHQEVVRFVRERRLYGRGVGWIDIHLLASALVDRLKLWTVNSRLSSLAKELGVA
jgi:predicted nucleic acid-binding protein